MPGIFATIQPLSKKERTTRSRTRALRTLKRVVANGVNKTDAFEHFCNISLNDRITGIMQTDRYEPVTFERRLPFLKNYDVFQSSSSVQVTVPCQSACKSPNKPQRKSLKSTKRSKPLNNNVAIALSDVKSKDEVLPELNTEITICEDDVTVVNPIDESVIIIEDSVVDPKNDLNYIPLSTRTEMPNGATLKATLDISCINIEDDEEDVIFVKEEVSNPYLDKKKKKFKVRNKKFKRRIVNLNGMKKKLNEDTFKIFRPSKITNLVKIRCVKCMKLNSEEAKRCNCQKGLNGSTNTSAFTEPRLPTRRETFNFYGEYIPIVSNPENRAATSTSRKLTNNNVQVPFNGTQNIPPVWNSNLPAREGLREIVIDGSNVAFGHSNGKFFSVKGLKIAIDHFVKRGHKVVAFVPQFRQKHNQTTNRDLLVSLADQGYVVFTPSREVNGRRITPYDDRYIIQYAAACEGVVVSSDNYRDLFMERLDWRATIERRLLMPTWVGDMLMFPEDPLGRHGPSLSRFLRFP